MAIYLKLSFSRDEREILIDEMLRLNSKELDVFLINREPWMHK